VRFAIAHVTVLAYQELLSVLAREVPARLASWLDAADDGLVPFFLEIATAAAAHARRARGRAPHIARPRAERRALRPRNSGGRAVPPLCPPIFARAPPAGPPESDADAEVERAYLLLLTLSQALFDTPSLLPDLQDAAVVGELLACGVEADSHSIVASQAFRLLAAVVVGEFADRSDVRALVAGAASRFVFEPEPTPQMIAAFRLFGNHEYEAKESRERVTVALRGAVKEVAPVRPRTVTPLEMYAWCVVDEPARSDQLCLMIMEKLEELAAVGDGLRGTEEGRDVGFQERLIGADLPVFDFLRAAMPDAFEISKNAILTEVLEEMAPPGPPAVIGREGQGETAVPGRVHVNGWIMKLAEFWSQRRLFCLTQESDQLAVTPPVPRVSQRLDRVLRGREDVWESGG
jgi:hypothetical protein